MNEKERTPAPRDRRVDAHRDVVAAARPCAIGIASLLKLRTADHRSALAVARCVIAALPGRFLPRLGPLAIASGPFFFSCERERLFPPSTNALLALDGWLTALEDGLHVMRRPIFFGWDDVNSLAGALQGIVAD